jgi:uncharacterized membrane protein
VRSRDHRDPILVTRRHGAGAVLSYMSDPAPHWGCNVVQWDRYNDFWAAALDALLDLGQG